MRAAADVRVSTLDQNVRLQTLELREYSGRQGWDIMATYDDVMSGAKTSRPGLNRLMEDAKARKFRLPARLETGQVRKIPCGLPEQYPHPRRARHRGSLPFPKASIPTCGIRRPGFYFTSWAPRPNLNGL